MLERLFISLAVIAVAALLGMSVAKVSSFDSLAFALGGAFIAVLAIIIAALFRRKTVSFLQGTPPRKLLGMRIGMSAFLTALCGWLIAAYFSPSAGVFVIALGILAGFIGMAVHFFNMVRK